MARSTLAIIVARSITLAGLVLAGCSNDKEPTRVDAELGLAALTARADMRGGKLAPSHDGPTLVTVFASWCQPCREELATIGELRAANPRLRVIGINAYESFDGLSDQRKLESFLADSAPWLTVVRDVDKKLIETFGGVPKIPTSFVFDARDRVVAEFRRDQRALPTRAELGEAIARASAR